MKPAVMNDDVGWPDKRKEEGPDPLAEVSWEQAQQGADPTISDMRAADADKIQVQTRDSARDARHEEKVGVGRQDAGALRAISEAYSIECVA